MVTFNIWHALHTGGLKWLLAIMVGLAPAGLAIGLSHIVAAHNGGGVMRGIAFLVMAGAMVLSVSATGDVVRPAVGNLWWLFGAVVDSAALVALQVILARPPGAGASAAQDAIGEAAGEPSAEPPAEPPRVPSAVPRQSAMRADKSPEAEQARAAWRRSVRNGQPLSDRALGEVFGKSRTWGASRIREAEAGPHPVAAAR
jgi:hypothetical protein